MILTAARLRRLIVATLLCTAAGLAGCSAGSPAHQAQPAANASAGVDETVAVVGDHTITRAELADRLMSGYGAEALRQLMLSQAVMLESASLHVTVSDVELDGELRRMSEGYGSETEFYSSMRAQLGLDRAAVREDARQRLLLEKLATRGVTIPDADVARYYEEHKQDYGPRRQYELAWIVTATKAEAAKVLDQLETGSDFAALARQLSVDAASADSGGNLGWVDDGDPVQDPRLLSAAGHLHVGEAGGPLQTDQGFAVIQLLGTKSVPARDLASVQEEIRRTLALDQAVPIHQLEQTLLAKYRAEVVDSRLTHDGNP